MSFTYKVYTLVNAKDDINVTNFETQIDVMNYLLRNGIENVNSIWKVSESGSLCMYEKSFRSTMTSETYYKNYTTLTQYDKYKLDENDRKIMNLCD